MRYRCFGTTVSYRWISGFRSSGTAVRPHKNIQFCAVMSEEQNCIGFLEMVLGFPISRIDVSYERNMVYHPEYKGIRLDVYAKDQNNKHYNVEMQVPESLVRFLKFVAADIEQSELDFEDEFVGQLQRSVHNVKESREMGERYMIFEEMMRDERKAGREEGELRAKRTAIFELLEDVGTVSEELKAQIDELSDEKQLKELLKLAAKAESIEVFERKVKEVLS